MLNFFFRDSTIQRSEIPKAAAAVAKELQIDKSEGWADLEKAHGDVGDAIATLDTKLNNVLRKQEYEYLQAYNIYVKRKEKELRELIDALNVKNSNNNIKDQRITQLEITID
jgi:chemotaxis methyl-accepting protein methylase